MGVLCQRERSMEQATNTEKLSLEQNLQGKTALITGASSGLGARFARVLAAAGARIIITARRADRLADLAEQITEADGQVLNETLDVSQLEALPDFYDSLNARGWMPDILVNNAGITRDGLLMRMKDEDWDAVLEVNMTASMSLCRAAMRGMMKAKTGRIISISSVVGVTGNPGQTNYAASKAGMIGFSKSLAAEVASRGLTVNVVAPGFIETPMTDVLDESQKTGLLSRVPAGRLGQADEIAAAVVFLASDEASYITGATLHVNGGMAML